MPFSKVAQSKGGSRSATAAQKAAARAWILKHRPWEKSTGPRSFIGKAISSGNRIEAFYHKVIKSWESSNFQQECSEAESDITQFEQEFLARRTIGTLIATCSKIEDGDRVVMRYTVRLE